MGVLVKIENKPYEDLNALVKSIFYKDEKLAEIAIKILKKIYRSEFGIRSGRWISNISEFFGVYPIDESEKEIIEKINNSYLGQTKHKRGVKQYASLIGRAKKGEITLSDEERDVLEKNVKWNSSISSYYTIIKKLKNIGLIEKKKGYLVKSKKFSNALESIKEILKELEKRDDTYVSK